jgi:polyisoprenoid-binding protein YceI
MTLLWIAALGCTTDVGEGKPKAEIIEEPIEDADAEDAVADAGEAAAPSTAFEVPPLQGQTFAIATDRSSLDALGAKITAKHPIKFHKFDGAIAMNGEDVTGVAFVADIASLESDAEKLTEHLKTEDFFDAGRFPVATFASTEVKAGAEGGTHTVTGDLTIRGKTHRVSFPATIEAKAEEVSAKTEFVINRQDFAITYPGKPDDLVQDNVVLTVAFVAPRTPAAEPAEGAAAEAEAAEGADHE